jgi:Tfp pilus assembly protein PilF
MMFFKIKTLRSTLLLCLIVLFALLGSSSPAFPLRTLELGGDVPAFTLPSLDGGDVDVLGGQGQITVILFWSSDGEGKLARGVELLKTLQGIKDSYGDQGVVVNSVNIDKNNRGLIREIIKRDSITLPVILDEKEALAGAYGLFIMPTVIIVDREGKLDFALGYTRNITEQVAGRVEVMLGLKTAEDLESELNPEEVVEIDSDVKKAQVRLNLGRKFIERRLGDLAGKEFEEAIKLDPANAEAHAELGRFYIGQRQYDKALPELEKAIELQSDLVLARLALGILHGRQKQYDKAIPELEGVLTLEPAHARAYCELGAAFEGKGDVDMALKNYRKSLSLLFEKQAATE